MELNRRKALILGAAGFGLAGAGQALAQAAAPTVLQRPIDLDTGQGVLHGSLLLPQQATPPPVVLMKATRREAMWVFTQPASVTSC